MGKREEINDHKWEMQFFELKKFKKKYGHCDVPQNAKKYNKLATWCGWQRKWKKFRPLEYDPDRIRKLDSIGFSWNVLDKWFENHFAEMEKYLHTHGHSYVSSTDNKALWKWCGHIREEKAKGLKRLTEDRIKRLDIIGFDWNPPEGIYEDIYFAKRLKELKDFISKFKKYPSANDTKYSFLCYWVETQRNDNLHGVLKKDRIKQLNESGFIWDARDDWWQKNFKELLLFSEKHGHANVSNSEKDRKYKGLAFWSRRQRDLAKIKDPSLTAERIEKLNNIGFSWTNPYKQGEIVRNKTSDNMLINELKELHKKLGRTPSLNDLKLYSNYKKGLYEVRFGNFGNAIAKAGLPGTDEEFWWHNFNELELFMKAHKRTPTESEVEKPLSFWMRNQRQLKKRGLLSKERIKLFNSINFPWNTNEMQWETHFAELKAYKIKFGHCNVPESRLTQKLGSWVNIQKRHYARESKALTKDRIEKLNSVGFDWRK